MGKVLTVRWTDIAAKEYEATIDWLLLNWNETIAMQFAINVETKIELLKKFPLLGNPSETISNCRKTLVPPYHILLYSATTDHIEIVRLFDTRQNPEKLSTENL